VQCVIQANKLLLQELNSLIEIELLSSDFLNVFGSKTKFLRVKTPVFPLCGRPWLQIHLCFFSHNTKSVACRYHRQLLSCCIACHDVCVQQQCCHRLLYKISLFTKKFTRSERNSLDLKIFVEVCSFACNDIIPKPLHYSEIC